MTTMASTVSWDLKITLHLEDGAFWATVAEYPGVFATGDTLEELRESLQAGIALVLAEYGEAVPYVELAELRALPIVTSATAVLVRG